MNMSKIKEVLDRKYDYWKIRKVSRISKKNDYPSLNISSELSKIGINCGDYVVVAIKGNTIIIEKL